MTAFSNDGKEFCFSVTDKEWSHFEIWYTKYDSNKWSEPQIIQLGSTGGFGPVFSPGDDTLFFSAGHWGKPPTADICFSKRTQTDWGEPVKLNAPINLEPDQWQCSVAKDGTFLFCSKRPGGKGNYDIYISEPINNKYTDVRNLEALNSPADEYSAFIAPDKSYIIFSSQRKGGYGWDDLYISFRTGKDNWSNPVNLGPEINTKHAEFSPQVTPDGKYLIYSKWDINNNWSDIYWVRIDNLIVSLKKGVAAPVSK